MRAKDELPGAIRKLLVALFCICISTTIQSQIIKGTILDAVSKKPVFYATAYINGSFVATYSDEKGEFELDITGYSSMPLIISALGYFSLTVNEIPKGNKLDIYLKPRVFELDEILVTSSGGRKSRRQRAENLKLFRDIFIGETINSRRCEISNEDDIRFQFSSNKDTMTVYSVNPLVINNNGLGYTVTYFLDRFEYCISDMLLDMAGNILFKEDISAKNREKRMFEKRRIRAYIGSRMHFFRALYENKLGDEGFTMRDSLMVLTYEEASGIKDTTGSDDLPKIVLYKRRVPEAYFVDHSSEAISSRILLRKQFFIFKKNGYFDGTAVIWEGEMAKQRIGDWLPYEYKPEL
jgi:hypothetical protein